MDRFHCTITRLCSLSGLYGQVPLYYYQTILPEWSLWTGSTVQLPDYVPWVVFIDRFHCSSES